MDANRREEAMNAELREALDWLDRAAKHNDTSEAVATIRQHAEQSAARVAELERTGRRYWAALWTIADATIIGYEAVSLNDLREVARAALQAQDKTA